jgi:diphosphomevalonate decarboxylase
MTGKKPIPIHSAAALAHPNIAFIKYWGNRDESLRLPANGSISMNLEELETQTTVTFSDSLWEDSLFLNGKLITGTGGVRITRFLDIVRNLAGTKLRAHVISNNNFPIGAGIASSASAFAALALAATHALGLDLDIVDLSRLARRGSGSACRSIPGGFVEWQVGVEEIDSYAFPIAPQEHWGLIDCIVVVSYDKKATGSTEGHARAGTSPLQAARVADAPHRLAICRSAIEQKDFTALAEIVEHDSNMMHAVMMTSCPPLFYWHASTLVVMRAIREARKNGIAACYSIDAGPNVHVVAEAIEEIRLLDLLKSLPGVREVRVAHVGGAARLI